MDCPRIPETNHVSRVTVLQLFCIYSFCAICNVTSPFKYVYYYYYCYGYCCCCCDLASHLGFMSRVCLLTDEDDAGCLVVTPLVPAYILTVFV